MKSIERLKNLILASQAPSPTQVFDKEVATRARRYAELRRLVAEVLFLEARQHAELSERRAELARFHHRALIAARKGQTRTARHLDRAKEDTRAAIVEAETELQQLRTAAEDARALLRNAGSALADLSREAEAVRRTERLGHIDRALRASSRSEPESLDAARLDVERLRAERALEAELRLLPESVG